MNYSLISGESGRRTLTVFTDKLYVADDTHPRFDDIVAGVIANDENVLPLFDLADMVGRKFENISERVSVSNGHVFFDGDLVNGSITKQIIRFLNEKVEDWKPLVAFFEKVQSNPNEHSRNQLYDWLQAHNFTITTSGDIVGYKGVNKNDDGTLVSGYSGHAIVDGTYIKGHIPNVIGSVIEMPRGDVAHDPSEACSTGLHVGTYEYAHNYANGAMLKVHINPRDVVSVPTDAQGEKVRVCRYRVVEIIDAPETVALEDDYEDAWDETEEYWEEGEPLEKGYWVNFQGPTGPMGAQSNETNDGANGPSGTVEPINIELDLSFLDPFAPQQTDEIKETDNMIPLCNDCKYKLEKKNIFSKLSLLKKTQMLCEKCEDKLKNKKDK